MRLKKPTEVDQGSIEGLMAYSVVRQRCKVI